MLRLRSSPVEGVFFATEGGNWVSTAHTFSYSTALPDPTGDFGDERSVGAAGTWPVLARIPDVSAAGRPADIRFDPPQPDGWQAARHGAAHRSGLRETAPSRDRHESTESDPAHLTRRRSRILPAGNPFAFSDDRRQESLAPFLRFVLLFALFTAAGTSILIIGRSGRTANGDSTNPTATTADPAIAVPTAMQQTVAAPAATGPRGAALQPAGDDPQSRLRVADFGLPTANSAEPPKSVTNIFPTVSSDVDDGPLPRIRTSDSTDEGNATDDAADARGAGYDPAQPPAIARLPGEIRAVRPH